MFFDQKGVKDFWIQNPQRVFTRKDTAIVPPNSDTPYSMLFMDLRAEPIVLCLPQSRQDDTTATHPPTNPTYPIAKDT